MKEEFATVEKIDNEEELLWGLESVVQFNYEWVVDLLENVPLSCRVHSLLALLHHVLLEDFHCIELACAL